MMVGKTSIIMTGIISTISSFCSMCHIYFNLLNMFNASYHVSDQSEEEAVPRHFETSPNVANFDSYPQKERGH